MTAGTAAGTRSPTPAASPPGADRPSAAGITLATGALTMVAGAVVYVGTGTDLWAALADDSVPSYLAAVAGQEAALHAALTVWCLGALLIAFGGSALAGSRSGTAGSMARTAYSVGAGLAITSFLLMMAVARIADQGAQAAPAAEALGFAGAHLDDVATAVLIGLGPLLLGVSGAVSGWLLRWAWVCGVAAGIAVLSIFFDASSTWGMVVVPVGIGWSLVAGIAAARHHG